MRTRTRTRRGRRGRKSEVNCPGQGPGVDAVRYRYHGQSSRLGSRRVSSTGPSLVTQSLSQSFVLASATSMALFCANVQHSAHLVSAPSRTLAPRPLPLMLQAHCSPVQRAMRRPKQWLAGVFAHALLSPPVRLFPMAWVPILRLSPSIVTFYLPYRSQPALCTPPSASTYLPPRLKHARTALQRCR